MPCTIQHVRTKEKEVTSTDQQVLSRTKSNRQNKKSFSEQKKERRKKNPIKVKVPFMERQAYP